MIILGILLLFLVLSLKPVFASEEMDLELDQIMEKFSSEDPQLRCEVADYLSYCGHPKAFGLLLNILKDPDWAVRIAAIKALGEMGDKKSVQHIAALLYDEYWHVRKEAVRVTGLLGGKDAVLPLMALMAMDDELIKSSAQKAIVKVGNNAIEGMLSKIPEQRCDAAMTLGILGDKRPLPLLQEALKIEKDPSVIQAIQEAINYLLSDTPPVMQQQVPAAPSVQPGPEMPAMTQVLPENQAAQTEASGFYPAETMVTQDTMQTPGLTDEFPAVPTTQLPQAPQTTQLSQAAPTRAITAPSLTGALPGQSSDREQPTQTVQIPWAVSDEEDITPVKSSDTKNELEAFLASLDEEHVPGSAPDKTVDPSQHKEEKKIEEQVKPEKKKEKSEKKQKEIHPDLPPDLAELRGEIDNFLDALDEEEEEEEDLDW